MVNDNNMTLYISSRVAKKWDCGQNVQSLKVYKINVETDISWVYYASLRIYRTFWLQPRLCCCCVRWHGRLCEDIALSKLFVRRMVVTCCLSARSEEKSLADEWLVRLLDCRATIDRRRRRRGGGELVESLDNHRQRW